MGNHFCQGESLRQSNIYLSDPENLAESQIRGTVSNMISFPGSYVGVSTSLILGFKEDQRREIVNKYLLTYFYFLKNKLTDPETEIEDFCHLLKIIDDNH